MMAFGQQKAKIKKSNNIYDRTQKEIESARLNFVSANIPVGTMHVGNFTHRV